MAQAMIDRMRSIPGMDNKRYALLEYRKCNRRFNAQRKEFSDKKSETKHGNEKDPKKIESKTAKRKMPPLPRKRSDVKRKCTSSIEASPKETIVEPAKSDEDLLVSIDFSSDVPTVITDLMEISPVKPKYSTVNATVPNQVYTINETVTTPKY